MEHCTASVGTSAMASSFNSLYVAEVSGRKQEEEGVVKYTVHIPAVAWTVCCLLLCRLTTVWRTQCCSQFGRGGPLCPSLHYRGSLCPPSLGCALCSATLQHSTQCTCIFVTLSFLHRPGVKNSVLSKTVHLPNSNIEPCGFLKMKIFVKQDALFCCLKG